jgi:flagella basal body P-ring formation protein FlgA
MKYLAIILSIQAAYANPAYEDLRVIEQSIATKLGTEAKPIDKRLRLSKCPEALSMTSTQASLVVVACNSIGWKIAVQLAESRASSEVQQIVVAKGEHIQLIANGSGFSVSRGAVALQSGATNTFIRIRLSDSPQILLARVTGPGRVALSQ